MPKNNIKYENTIIYKICCNDLSIKDIYLSHTTEFIRRKAQHKRESLKENNTKYNLPIYEKLEILEIGIIGA